MNKAPAPSKKVFLVEDSAPIRARLGAIIRALDNVEIVGEADTAPSAILGIRRTLPHIVVLDIHLREGTGLDVLRELRPSFPKAAFIVLSNTASDQYRRIFMQAGAQHFLDKTTEFRRLAEIIVQHPSASEQPAG